MTITLRPFNPETDYQRLAELTGLYSSEPIAPEMIQENDAKAPAGAIRRRTVALAEGNHVVGFSMIFRQPWQQPGHFHVRMAVDPTYRHQGIGARLFDEFMPHLIEQKAVRLESFVRDHHPEGLRFAEQRGFRIWRHVFESTLDVASFDGARFAGVVEAVEATGIRFFTMADLAGDPSAEQKLYELEGRLIVDVPNMEPGEWPPPFAEYRKIVFEATWYRPDGQVIAADGDRWVGMGAVGFHENTKHMYHNFTGVDPAYRGRGIALALKLLTIRAARRHNAIYMRTNNDSTNAPMLAINRKLGFRPEPGEYILVRDLA